ncbi:MAG: ankyrin repeat domain-containing protein [Bacteroidota bacterium]
MKKPFFAGTILLISLFSLCATTTLFAQEMADAIRSKKNDVVKALLDKGYDVNSVYHKQSALTFPIECENLEAFRMFLNVKGIKVNVWNIRSMPEVSWKYMALHRTTEVKEPLEYMKALLDKGALIDAQDEYLRFDGSLDESGGNTTLMLSVMNTESAKFLIGRGAKLNIQSRSGVTALMGAVPNLEILKLLVDKGAKMDLQNKGGETALMIAAREYPDAVKYLIDKGANISLRQLAYRASPNALDCAAITGNIESAKLLLARAVTLGIKDEVISASLHWAVVSNQLAMAKYLLDEGANVEGTDQDGHYTPLMETMMLEMVELLVQRGANVNAVNKFNYTPLLQAVLNFQKPDLKEKSNVKIITLLLDKGAKPDTPDGNGTTPLMWAVQKITPTKILIERGANVNIQNKNGETALMLAVKGGLVKTSMFMPVIGPYKDAVKLLIAKGADLNLQENNGKTALMHAAGALNNTGNDYGSYTDMAKILLDNGAKVNMEDKDKNTALYWAQRYNRTKTADLLIAKGANPAKKYLKTADNSNVKAGIVGAWQSTFKAGGTSVVFKVVFNADWTYSKAMITQGQVVPDGGNYTTYDFRDGRIWLFNKLGTNAVIEWRFEGKTLVLNGEKYEKVVKK